MSIAFFVVVVVFERGNNCVTCSTLMDIKFTVQNLNIISDISLWSMWGYVCVCMYYVQPLASDT